MSTPTPMPRTCGEISCDECNDRYAALAAECDQLRLDCENETKWAAHYLAQSIADKARAERAEVERNQLRAEVNALVITKDKACAAAVENKAEADGLRAAIALGQQNCDDAYDDLRAERAAAIARAERAEAELAAERARLDSGQILLTVAGERVWHCGVDLRAAIDAAMREGAK